MQMQMQMADRFFPAKQSSGGGNDRQEMLSLLSGPVSSGKTSLLFQLAVNVASACESNRVVFICRRKGMEANPPLLSQGMDPSSDVLDRIQMKYVDDDEGIRNYVAAFHLHLHYPAALLIDDFGDCFTQLNSRARDMAMVRTLALCHNAITHANRTAPCQLVLSQTTPPDSPRSLFIYKRWIPTIFTLQAYGHGSFLLRSNATPHQTAKYSIALQYLILEDMITTMDT